MLTWNWVSAAVGGEAPGPDGPPARVFVCRGVVGYWPDAAGMAARMSERGYFPRIHRSMDVPRLTAELISETQQGACGPIYLIGYSYGASATIRMARDLMQQGITVDRIALIECYDYPEIPANVRYCVNIYESRRLDRVTPFRGTPARAADPSSTELIDIDIAVTPEWEDVRQNNHFNMADDPRIQDFVAQQFPDMALRGPGDTSPVRVDAFPLLPQRPVNVPAPMPQALGSRYGFPNSTPYATRPDLPGVPSSSGPYASYRGLNSNIPFHSTNAAQVQQFATPQYSNVTPQAWSSRYGHSNLTPVTTGQEPAGMPRNSAYSSYRGPTSR